ncbi:hypothetical protein PIB30_087023 [Stylosanthes scabra]|uniref:Uncharacterized protein n=1 Tax=Stylosanthes scabra TaxID=79078 RepID=A0ABU6TV95_9FABA|nr:hypothetical protein [Stylosanthes scabra]
MSEIIKLMYDTPWPSYRKIPYEIKERWYEKWKEKFRWYPRHESFMKRAFDYRMGRRLSQMLKEVREEKKEVTQWCRPQLKRSLRQYWGNDQAFKHRLVTNKANRASSKVASLYCGGSVTIRSTKQKMEKELKREPVDAEEKYISDLEALTQEALEHGGEDGDGTTNPIDPSEVWRHTIGEPNSKNRIYGKGSFFASTLRATLAATMSPTTFKPLSVEVENQLREKIRELTQNLDERGRSLKEAEERIHVLLVRLEAIQASQSAQDLEAIAVARDQVGVDHRSHQYRRPYKMRGTRMKMM